MAKAAKKRRPAKLPATKRADAKATGTGAGLNLGPGGFRIDVDLDEAQRAAERVRGWLTALRGRHADLQRFEYTRHVRIVPASATFSHPILTLGTRFAESEDHLLGTYLHEQMHWYLWHLGGPDHDPVAPFFDELVRRYPKAPTRLPDGARNYEQTYVHLVVCWLELNATSEFIGWDRAAALAETNYGYRWIYRTVVRDWEALGELFTQHGILPMRPANEMQAKVRAKPTKRVAKKPAAKRPSPAAVKAGIKAAAAPQKTPATTVPPLAPPAPRKLRARGGRSAG